MKQKLHLKDLATVATKPDPVKEEPAVETVAAAPNVTPLPTEKALRAEDATARRNARVHFC
jgi:hypothetical protein